MKQLITEIQSWGVRVPPDIVGRNGGAGPAEGRAMLIEGVAVNVPICADYTALSPFRLVAEPNNGYGLYQQDTRVATVSVVPRPRFYNQTDSDGVPYWKIALLHGNDCLATTVLQRCAHWKNNRRCAFCGTERSLEKRATIAVKTSAQLTEVARHAQSEDQVSHMVLTSGAADMTDLEIDYMAQCAATIKASVQLPIHVQLLPPADLGKINQLKKAGVDTVGIHIESFDDDTLRVIAPAKARIGLDKYEAAWKEAVSIFGPNQVSSFLIAGLGESPDSIAWGSEFLADLGVYPFVVPLRPIPGSPLQDAIPPDPGVMSHIYQLVANILRRKGLTSRNSLAGCVRCGACSALPLYEAPFHQLTYHSARTDDELSQAFKVRREVFVKEQTLFADSDIDEFDASSIHIVAKKEGRIIGTVRAFPDPQHQSGHWVGGRLAVLKEFRDYRVGAALVKEAMIRVKKKGCVVFTAHIQKSNIRFFSKLGWEALGPLENYFGRPHQIMQADLSRVKCESKQNRSQLSSIDFDTAVHSPVLINTSEYRSLF